MKLLLRASNWIRSNMGLVVLWVIALVFGVLYAPRAGEWLLGWDNLAPEMDFSLNVSRQLSSVWQGYRGLGGVDGMAQSADLFRTLILWMLSFVVSTNYLRYVWLVLMLGLGMSGVFALFKRMMGKQFLGLVGLVVGIFYGFNLATIQMMYVPFETFTSFFGFLPWLLWGMLGFYKQLDRKSLGLFMLITILSAPSFMVQTLFLVYGLILVFLGVYMIVIDFSKNIKPLMTSLVLTLLLHSYWLAPVVYFAKNHASDVVSSSANSLSTPESIEMSRARSSVKDVVGNISYLLDYTDQSEDGVVYLMNEWVDHTQKPYVQASLLGLAGLSMLGLIGFGLRKKVYWPAGLYGLLVILMSRGAGLFSGIFSWLVEKVPFFDQLFRTSFTKWSLPLSLMGALGIGVMITGLKKKVRLWGVMGVLVLLMITSWPVFSGGYIYDREYVDFPDSYTNLFSYMDDQPNGRVLTLPMQHVWGWNFYDWGYRGSGFLWYGIKQPIMDRAFDVWNPYNEKAYVEISTALYRKDTKEFERLLTKYRISYILIDESVVTNDENSRVLFIDESKKLLETSAAIQENKNIDFLTLYDFDLNNGGSKDVNEYEKLFGDIDGQIDSLKIDEQLASFSRQAGENGNMILPKYGDYTPVAIYVKDLGKELQIKFKYGLPGLKINERVIFGEQVVEESITLEYLIKPEFIFVNGQPFLMKSISIDNDLLGYVSVEIPSKLKISFGVADDVVENEVFTRFVGGGEIKLTSTVETQSVDVSKDDQIVVLMPLVSEGSFSTLPARESEYNCDSLSRGKVLREVEEKKYIYKATGNGVSCDYILFDDRNGFDEYVLMGASSVGEGRGIRIAVHNQENGRTDFEKIIENDFGYIFSSSRQNGDMVVSFDVKSFGDVEAYGSLESLDLIPIDSKWIGSIDIVKSNKDLVWVNKGLSDIGGIEGNTILAVSESYENAWVGYLMSSRVGEIGEIIPWLFGDKLGHVKVNGWANGFVIPEGEGLDNGQVVVIFWPQYLQWGGLFLLIATPLWILIKKRIRSLN